MKEKLARDGKSTAAADESKTSIAVDDGLTPMEGLMLRREVRIGMAIIAVLVLIFGYVFVQKINENGSAATPMTDAASTDTSAAAAADAAAESNPPPTVVTAEPGYTSVVGSPSMRTGRSGEYATDAARHDYSADIAPPNKSYLPPRSAIDATATHAAKSGDDHESDAAAALERRMPDDAPTAELANRSDDAASPSDAPQPGVTVDSDAATDASRYVDAPAGKLPAANSVAIEATPIVEPARTREIPEAVDPPPTVARQSPAAEPRNRTYVSINGDTPASISERLYGDARYAAALMAYNGVDIAPDVAVNAGGEVLAPQLDDLRRGFAQLIPDDARAAAVAAVAAAQPNVVAQPDVVAQRTNATATRVYEVARGETVYDIARKELGRVARWREILTLNQDQLGGDIDAVAPGMKLRLPEDSRSEVARQRGELLWR